jgi:hypothetical protein
MVKEARVFIPPRKAYRSRFLRSLFVLFRQQLAGTAAPAWRMAATTTHLTPTDSRPASTSMARSLIGTALWRTPCTHENVFSILHQRQ